VFIHSLYKLLFSRVFYPKLELSQSNTVSGCFPWVKSNQSSSHSAQCPLINENGQLTDVGRVFVNIVAEAVAELLQDEDSEVSSERNESLDLARTTLGKTPSCQAKLFRR